MLSDWLVRLRALFRRPAVERDLEEELRFHLDREIDKHVRAGLAPADARRRALADLGGVTQIKEASRDAQGVAVADAIHRDIRYGIRALASRPAFTLVVVLTLAIGIGSNTAVFSLVDSVLLRPLPVDRSDRLATIEGPTSTGTPWSYAIWREIHDRASLFDGSLAWLPVSFNLASTGEADNVFAAYVSGSYFSVLGLHPAAGRLLSEDDDVRGGGANGPAVVISERFWQQRFARAPDALGRGVPINGRIFTIVGVAPAGFSGLDVGRHVDLYVPIGVEPLLRGASTLLDSRSSQWLNIMVRLRSDQSAASATALLTSLEPQIRAATMPETFVSEKDRETYRRDVTFSVRPAATGNSRLRGQYQSPLRVLLAAAGLVLLIACVNIANLLLVRAGGRRHEMGVRLALGATRGQLVRQLFVEGALLSIAGTLLAWPASNWAAGWLVADISRSSSFVFLDRTADWRVISFSITIAIATTVLCGAVPVWRATRIDAAESINRQSRGYASGGRLRGSSGLIVAQVALSLVLVVGAGLFVRTFVGLATLPLGFTPDRLLGTDVTLPAPAARLPGEMPRVYAAVIDAVERVPGVERAAAARIVPIVGGLWRQDFAVLGSPSPDALTRSYVNAVSPGWFATFGLPVIAGREFSLDDAPTSPRVAVVNQAFAAAVFPGENPIGRTVVQNPSQSTPVRLAIVGVVGNAVYRSLRETLQPTVYLPLDQLSDAPATFTLSVLSTDSTPSTLGHPVADALHAADGRLRITTPQAYADQLGGTIQQERLVAAISSFFGVVAMALAAIGLYGVTRFTVAQRERELGIRLMLGATPPRVVWIMLRRIAGLVVAGLAIGMLLSVWASRFIAAALFSLGPRDPLTLTLAAAILTAVAGLAAWLPARRLVRVDPMIVLREG